MPEITTKSAPVVKAQATHPLGIPGARSASVAGRTTQLPDESQASERAASDALGQLWEEVTGTSDVAKTIAG